MRRLLLLVCAVVWVDTMLYAALTPLLPHFTHTLHLSKAGAGVLVAADGAGALVGGLPGGAAAARLGPRRGALAALAVVLCAWTLRIESAPPEAPSVSAVGRALRNSRFLSGLALMALPSLLFGVLSTLAPLRLADAGWGAAAIGGVWLVGASFETVLSPVAGRVLDRRGVLLPVQSALAAAVAVSIGLAASPRPLVYVPLVILAGGAYGVLFTPAFALIAEGAERSGLPQGMAFGLMNAAWASGALIGPAAGGAIAAASGDVAPFVIAAVLCATALVAVLRQRTAGHLSRSHP